MQNINQKICHLIIGSMLSLGFLFLFLTSPTSATNPTSTAVSLDLINGIAIRILDSTGTSEINDLVFNLDASSTGTFSASDFNVEVDTSNRTGYKLYMTSDYQEPSSPGTYTTALVNLDNPDYTIPTLSSTVTKTDFSSGGEYKNHWGYSLDDTTYSPVPVHSTEQCIAGCNGEKDEPVAHDKTPVYIGMNVSLASASGTYRNNLLFSAIANPVPTNYTLSFNLNGGAAPSSDPDAFNDMTASEVAAQHTFTIPSIKPVRSGYMLSYWQDSQGNHYAPGDTITIIGNEEYIGTETLTAVWVVGCADGPNRICFIANEPSGTVEGEMEDQTIVYLTSASNSLDSTTLSSSTSELTLYSPNWTLAGYGFKGWNTKADGTGTMYGPNQTISTSDGTLTADMQTAIGSTGLMLYAQWVASAGDMAGWTGCSSMNQGDVTALTYGSDTYAVAKLTDKHCWMIENLRTSTNAGTATTSFTTSSYTSRQYNLTNVTGTGGANPAYPSGTSSSTKYQWKSYGGYYSWASAINSTSDYSTQYGNPSSPTGSTQGICPSSWRLPRSYYSSTASNDNAEFSYLHYTLTGAYTGGSSAVNSNKWRTYPNNFVFAGYWNSSSSYYRGTYGRYWSSTVYNSSSACILHFYSTRVDPQSDGSKYYGRSVRCVIGD